jgi:hypothetical protein
MGRYAAPQSRYTDPLVREQTEKESFAISGMKRQAQWADPNQRAAMTSGRATPSPLALELTPAGDIYSLVESGADILKGDYMGGALGAAVTAASVFVPGTIKLPSWVSDPNIAGIASEYIDDKITASELLSDVGSMAMDQTEADDIAMEIVDALIEASRDPDISITQVAALQKKADEIAGRADLDRTQIMTELAEEGTDFIQRWVNHPDFQDRITTYMTQEGYDTDKINQVLSNLSALSASKIDDVNVSESNKTILGSTFGSDFDPFSKVTKVYENANLSQVERTAAHELGHKVFDSYRYFIGNDQAVAQYTRDYIDAAERFSSRYGNVLNREKVNKRMLYITSTDEVVQRIFEYRYVIDKLIPNFGPNTKIDDQMLSDVADFMDSQKIDSSLSLEYWALGDTREEQLKSLRGLLETVKVLLPPAVFAASMYPVFDAPESQEQLNQK